MAEAGSPKTLFYKRSQFVTHLPVDCLYSPSHFWIAKIDGGRWRVGFTKFATRMLGEIVEHEFTVEPGAPVQSGQIIGWIEGFKALSDLYCIADGQFAGGNPALKQNIELISKQPYGNGWLYAVEGEPDGKCMNVESYRNLLDSTIDRILEKQKAEEQ
jgi:glycine cleavage system H protein